MVDNDLAFAPTYELVELIASKKVSPVEVAQLYFDRIDKLDSQLNSYLTLTRDEAMEAARMAENAVLQGDPLGPLHGVPISIKDLEMTKGIRTTSGSLIFKDRVPDVDSAVVERVRGAGAVILGKTNTPEFGLLGETRNRLGDHCRNPWNTERTTGGSSGGAGASVVAGLCSLATGSDGGGSVRIPSSFCGVYGIKPSQGRVPSYAGIPSQINNLFSQSGPMSRSVRDSAILLQVMAGHDPRDPGSMRETPPDFVAALDRDIKGLRIAWSPGYGNAPVDREVVEICSKAAQVFAELGASVSDLDVDLDPPRDAFWAIFCTSAYARNRALLEESPDLLTDYARGAIEYGATLTGVDYAEALGARDRHIAQFEDLFDRYDLLLSPTMPVPAFPVGQPPEEIDGQEVHKLFGYIPFTYPINMTGHTAASIPCGFSSDGLPVGLHIIGHRGGEEAVIAASAAFEQARPWIQRRPPVS